MDTKEIKIQIKQSIDKTFEVVIKDNATILELKQKCNEKTQINVAEQKIIFKGI